MNRKKLEQDIKSIESMFDRAKQKNSIEDLDHVLRDIEDLDTVINALYAYECIKWYECNGYKDKIIELAEATRCEKKRVVNESTN